MKESDLIYLKEQLGNYPQLSHASNILSKAKSKLSTPQTEALEKLVPKYVEYLKNVLALESTGANRVRQLVSLLNQYYNYMHESNLDNSFSAQGKFRPTILEEFLFLLFKDYVNSKKAEYDSLDVLNSGAVKAYSNLYFKAKDFKDFVESPEIGVNEKDQDYAIFRTFELSVNNEAPRQINIPAIAIEAKTYIDKTMLDSIIATAEKIKNGNPHTRFIAVAERYDVSYSVDPAYSRIDQIYVLRKTVHKKEWVDIDTNVVIRLYNETVNHLERPWFNVAKKIADEGVVI